ncbi:hypothetical protein CLV54_1541 [Compostimonas suwonensis]|uniref:Uncharacterized protein n=1 Tax=Compostimonas suwonensis TaxID=1048394 RepID=A0A2M9C0K1_9MICO|nr:hypothetical protein CLV54_1541 [Compostimonas suwonensis]
MKAIGLVVGESFDADQLARRFATRSTKVLFRR